MNKKNTPKSIVITIFLFILVSLFVFAVTEEIQTFKDKLDPFNVSFAEAGNKTLFIEVPIYSQVDNITIEVKPHSYNP